MRETGPKITVSNNKLTIASDGNVRIGPLLTLLEGYLQLNEDQQDEIDSLVKGFLRNTEEETIKKHSEEIIAQTSELASTLEALNTKKDRILYIVNSFYPLFLAVRDIREVYQQYLPNEDIGISTIQTTLNRLVDAGLVERKEGVNPIEYRINPQKAHEIPRVL
ncbi:MAG: hypothetical protein ACFFG0_55565 [Candidatus Thorarchaeota archaeon]